MDIPDLLQPLLPIIYRLWQVFRVAQLAGAVEYTDHTSAEG